ncbi:MAG TPA: glycosyltransferase family 39 protein [Candidatus Paceibacterota bacterium]
MNTNTESRAQVIHILLGAMVLIGLFFRLVDLGAQSLWIDEGFSINAAQAIIAHGYPMLDSGKIYTSSPLNAYGIAGAIQVLGFDPFNPWTARLPSAVFGIGVIALMYFFALRIFQNKYFALLAATLIAFSYWEIDWSRQARGYIELQFFMLLALWQFWKWLEYYTLKNLAASALAYAAAYASHGIAVIFAPAFAVTFLAHYILNPQQKIKAYQLVIGTGSIALLGAIIIAPKLWGSTLYDFSASYIRFLFGDLRIITLVGIVGIILGIFDKKHFWPVIFLAIFLLFPLVVVMFYASTTQLRYLFPMFPFLTILALYAISRATDLVFNMLRFNEARNSSNTLFVWSIIVVVAMLMFWGQLVFRPQNFYQSEFDSPRPDFKAAYALIAEQKQATDIVISPYAHLTKIYLGEKGMWLPISLTGKQSELKKTIIDGKIDYYVGAPIVENTEHLQSIIEQQNGYMIIDGMAKIRLGAQAFIIANHPNVTEIFHSGSARLNQIWVYKF